MAGQVRTAHVGAALASYRSLQERLPTLTLAEVEYAIDVELATLRRQSLLTSMADAAAKKYRVSLYNKIENRPKE